MEHKIAIGNVYRRNLGAMKQFVTIDGFDTDVNKWKFTSKSGKVGTADEKTIANWEVISVVESKEEVVKKEKAKGEKKKNNITCLEAAIQTLVKRNVPMTAKMLVKAMTEDGVFYFSPTAKTPWNSVGTRLTTYMNNCQWDGVECRVKQIERGKFVHKDYVAEPSEE